MSERGSALISSFRLSAIVRKNQLPGNQRTDDDERRPGGTDRDKIRKCYHDNYGPYNKRRGTLESRFLAFLFRKRLRPRIIGFDGLIFSASACHRLSITPGVIESRRNPGELISNADFLYFRIAVRVFLPK